MRLAGGRSLPPLLFATNVERLRKRIGQRADDAVSMIRDAGHDLLDVSDVETPWVRVAAATGSSEGVVLLGGYDVIRAQRLDVLPSALRSAGGLGADPDDYVVWSDDCFGDVDDDGLPELPVSRVVDAGSADLLMKTLSAPSRPSSSSRFGIRNLHRTYADGVFAAMEGSETLNVSAPFEPGGALPCDVDASGLYLVLHGSNNDPATLWGERDNNSPIAAFTASCVPDAMGGVVLAGACWGALTIDPSACKTSDAGDVVPRTIDRSVALSFLAAGASAFVGATGAHFSPISEWIHLEFWNAIGRGLPPARALLEAKNAFVPRISDWPTAAEVGYMIKTWRQFTCLGLAW